MEAAHNLPWIVALVFICACLLLYSATTLVGGCASPDTLARRDQGKKPAQLAQSIDKRYAEYKSKAFAGTPEITVKELLRLSEQVPANKRPILIDCRTPDEIAVSIIPGALSKREFEANRAAYKDKILVPYCTIGYRSGIFTKQLRDQGMDARNLKGGVLSWALAGRLFVAADGAETRRVHVYGAKWNLIPAGYEGVY